jgi:hypothetical protein
MSHRIIASLAAVVVLGAVYVSTDALARPAGGRGGGGAHVSGGGVNRGNVNRNVNRDVNVNRRVGYGAAAVGAAAVGAAAYGAATAPCGYFPYPECY